MKFTVFNTIETDKMLKELGIDACDRNELSTEERLNISPVEKNEKDLINNIVVRQTLQLQLWTTE